MAFISEQDLENGKTILIDKELHWSSFDVVKKVKYSLQYHLKKKKIKVGHAGTLDPLASGLMILCLGAATKRIGEFQDLPKEYVATIHLGSTTPSYDLETTINKHFPTEHITPQLVNITLKQFVGPQLQVPPLFSAKKVGGKRAYEIARTGSEMELEPNAIHINEIILEKFEKPELLIRVHCSKGTYIRSLAHDIGKALNSGAHLTGLRRCSIGAYHVEQALTIKEFENKLKQM